MAESWRERWRRESREVHDAVAEVLSRRLPDTELRARLEELARRPQYPDFGWMWGPSLWTRDRVLFRPLLLAHASSFALDRDGKPFDPWKGRTAAAMEAWLKDADLLDDVQVFRRLYEWKLRSAGGEKQWRQDVQTRFEGAASPAERHLAVSKVDLPWYTLDESTALALWEKDPPAARELVLRHLPRVWPRSKGVSWPRLLDLTRARDRAFHLALYRRLVSDADWKRDVLACCDSVSGAPELVAALDERHPEVSPDNAAEVLHEVLVRRGDAALPYVLRRVRAVGTRWRWYGRGERKGVRQMLELARERGWDALYGLLLRASVTPATWNREVRRLLDAAGAGASASQDATAEREAVRRLLLIAGPGREASFPGWSIAQVHPLEDATAASLYGRFPGLLRGPYRMHASAWGIAPYRKLVLAALERDDEELADYLASRAALMDLRHGEAEPLAVVEALAAHYEALQGDDFVRRAAHALSMMPAYAIGSYDGLLAGNALARLLFERSTHLYPAHPGLLRDLLESPQIHVQLLALRVLALDDPRARAAGAAAIDLLQATLFRPLHRRSRLHALRALANAAAHDEQTARRVIERAKLAFVLPDVRYPKEALLELVARVLHRWPGLRTAHEQPLVFGREATP